MPKYGAYPVIASVEPTDYLVFVDVTDNLTKQCTVAGMNAIVGNITQSVTGNRTITTSGTLSDNVVGNRTVTVDTNKYSHVVTAASGNVQEDIAGTEVKNTVGNKTVTVNTNKYSHAVVAASGNVTESIAGTEVKNTAGDVTRTVNTDKYSQIIEGATGSVTEVIKGSVVTTIEIDHQHDVLGDYIINVDTNMTETVLNDKVVNVTNTFTENVADKQINATGNFEVAAGADIVLQSTTDMNVICGGEKQDATTGNYQRTVNTNKFIENIDSATGDTSITIAGDKVEDVTGERAEASIQNRVLEKKVTFETVGAATETITIPFTKAGQVTFSFEAHNVAANEGAAGDGTARSTINATNGNNENLVFDAAMGSYATTFAAGEIRLGFTGEAGKTIRWTVIYSSITT